MNLVLEISESMPAFYHAFVLREPSLKHPLFSSVMILFFYHFSVGISILGYIDSRRDI